MTSKTFKSEVSQGRLSISDTRNGLFTVAVRRGGESVDMIDLKTETAPALCLAILEAAGYKGILASEEPGNLIEKAYSAIRLHIKEQERITAEAKAQAELEAEALELINAYRDSMGYKPCGWESVGESDRKNWLAVARKAREMRAEK